jgi:hypothetical protein
MSRPEHLTKPETLVPLVDILASQFINRWDVYPKQLDDGTYVTIHEPLTHNQLMAHLRGEVTLGTYLLNEQSLGHFLVLDADDEPNWRRLRAIQEALGEWGVAGYLERSRRGGHLWFFTDTPMPGNDLRRFGQGMLAHFDAHMEIYPKQGELQTGPGSLMRLPFGIHRLAQRRYGFITGEGNPLALSWNEQIRQFERPQTVPKWWVDEFMAHAPIIAPPSRSEPIRQSQNNDGEGDDRPVAERIKASVSVYDFVSQYITLSNSGKGLCPFHDDHRPSFSVNTAANYWHCFACQMGGSIIDFWMQYNGCDFKTAIRELAAILLE